YLKSDGQELPGSPTKFDQNWKMTEEGKTDYVPRKRAGPGSIAFRRLLARTIRTPGTERTLWLVCAGGMLSKAALEREFRRPKRTHPASTPGTMTTAKRSGSNGGL
ncbi:MAG: hypothetical protein AB1544_15365, partial [Pseudomonadota bacterium]